MMPGKSVDSLMGTPGFPSLPKNQDVTNLAQLLFPPMRVIGMAGN